MWKLPWVRRDDRPWVLLDVDGVLNPSAVVREPTRERWTNRGALVVRASIAEEMAHTQHLVRYAVCSAWGDDANDTVMPLLGMPPIPVIDMIGATIPPIEAKVAGVRAWAARTPSARGVWIDDELPDDWSAGGITGIHIDGNVGLTADRLRAVLADLL